MLWLLFLMIRVATLYIQGMHISITAQVDTSQLSDQRCILHHQKSFFYTSHIHQSIKNMHPNIHSWVFASYCASKIQNKVATLLISNPSHAANNDNKRCCFHNLYHLHSQTFNSPRIFFYSFLIQTEIWWHLEIRFNLLGFEKHDVVVDPFNMMMMMIVEMSWW